MTPRLREALWDLVGASVRIAYRHEVQGLDNFTRSGATLAVANHRRDSDGPIIGHVLRGPRRRRGSIPHIVAREDMFSPEFLGDYLDGIPKVARRPLATLNLGTLFQALHAHPMRRIPERTVGEVLDDVHQVLGDLPLAEVLRPAAMKMFVGIAGETELRLAQVRGERYRSVLHRRHGYRALNRPLFAALKCEQRQAIHGQLETFARFLETGQTVQLKPEGVVSSDGHFGRMRACLYELLARTSTPVCVLPIGITYDFMSCARRPSVFLNIGPELIGMQGLDRRELNRQARSAILRQCTVTATQLASECLHESNTDGNDGIVTFSRLQGHVAAEAERFHQSGAHVDPRLLSRERCKERVRDYLAFTTRAGLISAAGRDACRVHPEATVSADYMERAGMIGYSVNELASFRSQFESPSFVATLAPSYSTMLQQKGSS